MGRRRRSLGGREVLPRDAENDRVDCNGGIDVFIADLRDDPISAECEQVDQGAVEEGPNVVVRSRALRVLPDGTVAVRLRCPRRLDIPCAGRLAVRLDAPRTRFGSATSYRMRRGRSTRLVERGRGKRLKGFEPSTFCMAIPRADA